MATSDSDTTDVSVAVPQIQVDDLGVNLTYNSSDDFAFNSDNKDDCADSRDPIKLDDAKSVLDETFEVNSSIQQGTRKEKPAFPTQAFKSVSLDSKMMGSRRSNVKVS